MSGRSAGPKRRDCVGRKTHRVDTKGKGRTAVRPTTEPHLPRYSLESIVVVLLVLWLLGAFVVPVAGALVHLLLLVVLVVVVLRVLQGRRPL